MKIAILGSTGSIGTQTLKVVEELNAAAQTESNPHIEIAALAAGDNVERIARQAAVSVCRFSALRLRRARRVWRSF